MSRLFSRTRVLRALVAVVATLGVTGCDEPFSPYWDRGTYYLHYANNRSLPAVVSDGPAGAYTSVEDGSLTLRRDHSYQLVIRIRERDAFGRVVESSKVFAGPYDNDGRTLWLTYFAARDGYPSVMVANWRGGRVEIAVPEVDGSYSVLCTFD